MHRLKYKVARPQAPRSAPGQRHLELLGSLPREGLQDDLVAWSLTVASAQAPLVRNWALPAPVGGLRESGLTAPRAAQHEENPTSGVAGWSKIKIQDTPLNTNFKNTIFQCHRALVWGAEQWPRETSPCVVGLHTHARTHAHTRTSTHTPREAEAGQGRRQGCTRLPVQGELQPGRAHCAPHQAAPLKVPRAHREAGPRPSVSPWDLSGRPAVRTVLGSAAQRSEGHPRRGSRPDVDGALSPSLQPPWTGSLQSNCQPDIRESLACSPRGP